MAAQFEDTWGGRIHCCICGWSIFQHDTLFPASIHRWFVSARLLHPNPPIIGSPITTTEISIFFDRAANELYATKEDTQHRLNIPLFRHETDPSIPGGYPLHQVCWDILASRLRCYQSSQEYQSMITRLYELFESTAYLGKRLQWPHGYYYDCRLWPEGRFWMEFDLDDSHQNDPSMEIEDFELNQDFDAGPFYIPDFLPQLPKEIVLMIIDYLSHKDLERLRITEGLRRFEVPDTYWKQFLALDANLGFWRPQNSIHPENDLFRLHSAYKLFQISRPQAKRMIVQPQSDQVTEAGPLRNSYRVWKICNELSNFLRDMEERAEGKFEAGMEDDYEYEESSFKVSAESKSEDNREVGEFSGTKPLKISELEWYDASELVISYCGSGYLRFVSGIQSLPSGAIVGYMTKWRRKISFKNKNAISVAMSKYGLVDISISEPTEEHSWSSNFKMARKRDLITITRRLLKPSRSPFRNIGLQVKVDATKVVSIEILTDDLLPEAKLESKDLFLQKHNWSRSIPMHHIDLNETSYAGRPVWRASKFQPTDHLRFGFSKLQRVTVWALDMDGPYIAGIMFHFLDEDKKPLKIGLDWGVPVDFLIDGRLGEYVAEFEVFLSTHHGLFEDTKPEFGTIRDLNIQTNWGRTGGFTGLDQNDLKLKRKLMKPKPGQRIVGIYGTVNHKNESIDLQAFISTLGIFTEPDPDPNPKTISLIPETAIKYGLTATRIPKHRAIFADNATFPIDPHFVIRAPGDNITKVRCFETIHYPSHIVGVLLQYRANGEPTGETTHAQLLGRMSGAREIKPSLECTEWDFVRQIDVYRNANWSTGLPNDEIDGLKVMTLMDEEVTFGDCQGIMHSIVMEKDTVLRWDFNRMHSSLTDEKEVS